MDNCSPEAYDLYRSRAGRKARVGRPAAASGPEAVDGCKETDDLVYR